MDDTTLMLVLCAPVALCLMLWLYALAKSKQAWPTDGRPKLPGTKEISPQEPIDFDGAKLVHQLRRSIAEAKERKKSEELARLKGPGKGNAVYRT